MPYPRRRSNQQNARTSVHRSNCLCADRGERENCLERAWMAAPIATLTPGSEWDPDWTTRCGEERCTDPRSDRSGSSDG